MTYMMARERMTAAWPLAPLLCALFVYIAGLSVLVPSLVDVLLDALCPGQSECSQVILLSGMQATMMGIGAIVAAPILGGLSDDYGRKPVLLLLLTASLGSTLVLAYSREKVYVEIWWVLNVLGGMLREAGLLTITLAFVADVVPDSRQRAPAIGIAMSSISVGLLVGTLIARAISSTQIFTVAAALQIAAVFVVKFFLIESHPRHCTLLPASVGEDHTLSDKLLPLRPKPNLQSMLKESFEAVRSSKSLRTVAAVAFMVNITETVLQSTLLYYLKAVFGFGKDEFAQFMVLAGSVAIISQMVAYPLLAHALGERGVLWLGLLGGAVNSYLYAFAWAEWVPYFACLFGIFGSLVPAAIGTIVSRGAEPEQQGKVLGLVASVKTVASVICPIALTPLTAAFLSDDPPFKCPGFTLMIGGTAMVVAGLISLALPRLPTPDACFRTVVPTTDEQIIITTSEDVSTEGEKERRTSIEP